MSTNMPIYVAIKTLWRGLGMARSSAAVRGGLLAHIEADSKGINGGLGRWLHDKSPPPHFKSSLVGLEKQRSMSVDVPVLCSLIYVGWE